MSVNITIRDVPDQVKQELAARAALEGKSMQEYLRIELIRISEAPVISTWLTGVRERKAAYGTRVSAQDILKARDAERR